LDFDSRFTTAAANALVGLRENIGAGAAFVRHVGYWSHFDNETGHSSWPFLPATSDIRALADSARRLGLLWDPPEIGDVFLIHSHMESRFVHAGVIASVDAEMPIGRGEMLYTCTTVEAGTGQGPNPYGRVLRRERRLCTATGGRFIRWVDLDGRRMAA